MKRLWCRGLLALMLGAGGSATFAPFSANAQEADVAVGSLDASTASVINETLVNQWVAVGSDNALRGKVQRVQSGSDGQPMAGAKVVLMMPRQPAITVQSDREGNFEVANCPPGNYACVVAGENAFAAFALHVLPPSADASADDVSVLEVPAAAIERDTLLQMIRGYLPTEVKDYSWQSFSKDPLAADRSVTQPFRIVAGADGALIGKVALPPVEGSEMVVEGMNIAITRGNEIVGRAQAESDGSFRVAGLDPGNYGMVVAGKSGFAFAGFELLSQEDNAQLEASSGERLVGIFGRNKRCCPCLNVEILPCECAPVCEEVICEPVVVEEVVVAEAPVEEVILEEAPLDMCGMAGCGCMGGGYGGYGGGGGGGLGGGGFGDLLGLAGLAGVAYAISEADGDDNGFRFGPNTPPPSSPSGP
jgi:hypothetical protein